MEGHENGRYKLITNLGRGGFSHLWKAFDMEQEHFCALKTPHKNTEDQKKLLEYEADITRELDHEGVIKMLELFESSGRKYLAMEFSPYGCFKTDVKKHGPMTETRCMFFFKQVRKLLFIKVFD